MARVIKTFIFLIYCLTTYALKVLAFILAFPLSSKEKLNGFLGLKNKNLRNARTLFAKPCTTLLHFSLLITLPQYSVFQRILPSKTLFYPYFLLFSPLNSLPLRFYNYLKSLGVTSVPVQVRPAAPRKSLGIS